MAKTAEEVAHLKAQALERLDQTMTPNGGFTASLKASEPLRPMTSLHGLDKLVATLAQKRGISIEKGDGRPKARVIEHEGPVIQNDNAEEAQSMLLRPSLYDCPICKNRGYTMRQDEQRRTYARTCRCMAVRKGLRRLELSGLGELSKRYNFESYQTREPWMQAAKQLALEFSERDSGGLFYSGRTGTGKTHLCTAVCKRFIHRGMDVMYMQWVEDSAKAKQAVNDYDAYQTLIQPWKDCKVLYIDDMFKTDKNARPTPGDVRLAYEIINARYRSPSKITIISTELQMGHILAIDEATGGRIAEMSGKYMLDSSGRENWRLAHAHQS